MATEQITLSYDLHPFGPLGVTDPSHVRSVIRLGQWGGHTSSLAPGFVQGNVVILERCYADDFLRYCLRNPKPCPVLNVSDPGAPILTKMGKDIDIRTDVPRYRMWRNGVLEAECENILNVWSKDLVSFLIGCSFSFEQALIDEGIPLRHVQEGRNVAMYETNIPTVEAGPFSGPMVVSMRPMKTSDAIRAIQITSRYPSVHGAPIHFGSPSEIGIRDLNATDYGESIKVLPNETPVFWACGVTPQAAIQRAKLPFVITHSPGAMLITDLRNHSLASF